MTLILSSTDCTFSRRCARAAESHYHAVRCVSYTWEPPPVRPKTNPCSPVSLTVMLPLCFVTVIWVLYMMSSTIVI